MINDATIALTIEASPKLNAGRSRNITPFVTSWTRSKRLQGGCHTGSLSMRGDTSLMEYGFNSWLGMEIREYCAGSCSWRGYISEIDYTNQDGWVHRKSLNITYTHVVAEYSDASGNVKHVYGGTQPKVD